MKTGFAMLVGAGVLSLAVGVGSATAAVRYHHRHMAHMAKAHALQQAPMGTRPEYTTFEDAHNPAKKYPARQISENAVNTGTLLQTGNNPGKRYPVRQISDNAVKTGTLSQSGNNPAKRYKSTASTTGAAPR
jgi:hypothetical protein